MFVRFFIFFDPYEKILDKEQVMREDSCIIIYNVSLWDLITRGFIAHQDVDENGSVSDDVRRDAETRYRAIERRPTETMHRYGISEMRCRPQPATTATVCIPEVDTYEYKCCVCMTNPRTYAFDPCFHLCVCNRCVEQLAFCPICRKKVVTARRIWW